MITSVRNYLYSTNILKSTYFKTPTIIVGNLTVGGTGKTPQIEYLIRLLQKKVRIAVLSRGYKRKSKGFMIATHKSDATTIGDEPFQYFQKFKDVIVCVDADRTNGIQQLEQLNSPPEIILLDDAFQHRKVVSDLNILLTSYNDLYVDDRMLPTGNLRENKSGAKRAHYIVVTKCPENLSSDEQLRITQKLRPTKSQIIFFTSINYSTEIKGASRMNLSALENSKVLLITGIANPSPLVNYLKSKNIDFNHMEYPDHYHFKDQDIRKIKQGFNSLQTNNKIILTTEKDYVRIFDKLKNVYFISIKIAFINPKNEFDKLITSYVEQSTRNG